MTTADAVIVLVAVVSTAGVIIRPLGLPEALWACGGALLLVVLGLLPVRSALAGIAHGTDVYFFLAGMMLVAEAGRAEGLFDWLAEHAVRQAAGSPRRLFATVYGVGVIVTVFLSNDATAVVLTPAVYAAAKAANAEPLPYLLICAFVANAASFVLPISNPANLVVYGADMPALPEWLAHFALPSAAAIAATYVALLFTQRKALDGTIATATRGLRLSRGGILAAAGACLTAATLAAASFLDLPLGAPAFLAGLATVAGIVVLTRRSPIAYVRSVSWSVLPLVAGLFVLVEALEGAGLLSVLTNSLDRLAAGSVGSAVWAGGALAAFATNLVNNLPAGLLAGAAIQAARPPPEIASAVLVGIDLGPNLSVTGSLATILWLAALRREGQHVTAWQFLRIGCVVMPAALAVALAAVAFAR